MQQQSKERLIGATVLVVIAVIFIPIILTDQIDSGLITETNIPARPTEKVNSKPIPLTESLNPLLPKSSVENIINNTSDTGNNTEKKATETVIDSVVDIKSEELTIKEVAVVVPLKSIKEEANLSNSIKPEAAPTKFIKDKQVGLTAWIVQLGSFSNKINADKLNSDLKKSGFPAFVEPLTKNKKTVYRVRVGPELLRQDAVRLLKKIKAKMKLDGIIVSYP